MSDINKYIGVEVDDLDKADRLRELGDWDEAQAAELARGQGIELTDRHWPVLRFVRDHYIDHGATSARDLTEILEQQFSADGGLKYLYTLFPNGPVNQASRIAGVPVPRDATEPSFGSVR